MGAPHAIHATLQQNTKVANSMNDKRGFNKDIYDRPVPGGMGLAPTWSQAEYRGIPLTEDVARRIAEYRAYRSLTQQDIARMLT